MKTIHLGLLIIFGFALSCKNDPKSTSNKSKTTLLDNTGIMDISDKYEVRQNQVWPEVPSFLHFRSSNIIHVYLNPMKKDSLNYGQNDVISIVGRKVGHGVDFIVESLDLNASPAKIQLKTVKNDKIKNEHRPSFVISIPKKYTKATPIIVLDSVLVGGMLIE